jgi:hypothetical protein
MVHVSIAFRVVYGIVAKIPCSTIIDLLLVRNQTIDFLYISLEVAVVLECLILSHDRLWVLVEPIGARSEGSTASQDKQRTAQKGFDIIIIFHNRYSD